MRVNTRSAFLAAVTAAGLAATAPSAPAQAAAAATDTSLAARTDRIFAQWDRSDSPGCALGVFRDGRIVYARGYGMANLELGVALSPQSVLDIGSTSKQMTAMAVVLLAQQGRLSLEDDVRKHIPELPAYEKPITVRHLLTHTSGLRDYLTLWYLAGIDDADFTTEAEALDIIRRQKALNFLPGEQRLYSNSGFFLASVIVERVSGRSLARFAEEHIFRPLGMRHTRFNNDHTAVIQGRATGYARRDGGGYSTSMSDFEQIGDGGVLTSIEDLQRWDENFYTGQVGGRATLEKLHQRAVLNNGRTEPYALGLIVDTYRGLRRVRHGGSWAGYRAELMRFPDQHFSVAVLCNLAGTEPTTLARRVAEVYLAPSFAAAPAAASQRASAPGSVALAARDVERYAGLYQSARTGELRRIRIRADSLQLTDLVSALPLESVGVDRFRVPGAQAGPEVRFDATRPSSRRLELISTSGDTLTFERVMEASPTARDLAAYAGTYWSEEVSAEYRLDVKDGALVLHRRRSEPVVLAPTYADAFSAGGVLYRFTRTRGRVTEMLVDAGRIRNLTFVRRSG
ncbi:MAG: beta-lactamase family protein [Gemmatimonadota bacterium]|nr:beta-lactamase family protein [Gemmatimonadota bacterium]